MRPAVASAIRDRRLKRARRLIAANQEDLATGGWCDDGDLGELMSALAHAAAEGAYPAADELMVHQLDSWAARHLGDLCLRLSYTTWRREELHSLALCWVVDARRKLSVVEVEERSMRTLLRNLLGGCEPPTVRRVLDARPDVYAAIDGRCVPDLLRGSAATVKLLACAERSPVLLPSCDAKVATDAYADLVDRRALSVVEAAVAGGLPVTRGARKEAEDVAARDGDAQAAAIAAVLQRAEDDSGDAHACMPRVCIRSPPLPPLPPSPPSPPRAHAADPAKGLVGALRAIKAAHASGSPTHLRGVGVFDALQAMRDLQAKEEGAPSDLEETVVRAVDAHVATRVGDRHLHMRGTGDHNAQDDIAWPAEWARLSMWWFTEQRARVTKLSLDPNTARVLVTHLLRDCTAATISRALRAPSFAGGGKLVVPSYALSELVHNDADALAVVAALRPRCIAHCGRQERARFLSEAVKARAADVIEAAAKTVGWTPSHQHVAQAAQAARLGPSHMTEYTLMVALRARGVDVRSPECVERAISVAESLSASAQR